MAWLYLLLNFIQNCIQYYAAKKVVNWIENKYASKTLE